MQRLAVLERSWLSSVSNDQSIKIWELAIVRFDDDEGLVTCKLCKQSWPTVNIAKNPGKETLLCTGTSTHIDDWTEQTTKALAQWNKGNPNSHRLAIDHARHRWTCTRCGIHGFKVISTDTTRKTKGKYRCPLHEDCVHGMHAARAARSCNVSSAHAGSIA